MPDMGVDPAVPGSEETGYVIWFPASKIMFVAHHFTTDATLFPGLVCDAMVELGHVGVMLNTLGTWSRDDSKLW